MKLSTLTYAAMMAGVGLSILSQLPARVKKSNTERYQYKTDLLELVVDVSIVDGQKRPVVTVELSNANTLNLLQSEWLSIERDLGFQLQNYKIITRGIILKELNFLSSTSKLKFKVLDND